MTKPQSGAEQKRAERLRARVRRAALAAVVGLAAGAVCGLLPPEYQAPCSTAAKLVSLLIGGH